MPDKLKVITKKLADTQARPSQRMTGSQLVLSAERMTHAIEKRAQLRGQGKLPENDDVLEITEWL